MRSNSGVANPINNSQNSLTLGLSFVTGVGLILMVSALGVGVIQGGLADSNAIGLAFIAGAIMFILGLVAWFSVVQPHKKFDDINVPQYTGHHDEEHE
jgi:hypothetical protein